MTNREWERFGEEIRRTVQDAVDSRNYEKLNQTITNTINQAVNTVAWNVKNFNDSMNQKRANNYRYQQPEREQYKPIPKEMLYDPKGSSNAGSILMMVFGYVFGGMGLILMLILGILGPMLLRYRVILPITVFSGLMTVVFGTMAIAGTRKLIQSNRFKKYLRALEGREFCNLAELETKLGKPRKYIAKDLEKMIKKGWFRQGHLDYQKTCLIVTDRMYQQYQQIEIQKQQYEAEEKIREQRKQKQMQESAKAQEESRQKLSPEVRKVIEEGDAFVQRLRECNDVIPGEEISAKISRMEMVVDKIFDRVEQNPELVNDVCKLMEYYLPTTIKLLDAYAEMDAQPVGGQNIQTAKAEIEATLDTLNLAFEKLLDSLFQDTAWDVSSDISVLNTMLAQEGLNESDFINLKK